ncbi:MAG: hypothetical protein RLZZ584_1501 [Pseudomonadota bacterium]|jgi:rhodanese-related sulfurtransferase
MPTEPSQPDAPAGASPGPARTPVLIGVRTAAEFARSGLEGAVNPPLTDLAREAGRVVPDRRTPVALCCATGARTAMGCALLAQLGYRQVIDAGGLFMAAAHLGRALRL